MLIETNTAGRREYKRDSKATKLHVGKLSEQANESGVSPYFSYACSLSLGTLLAGIMIEEESAVDTLNS
jgi:hypothetical protein